MIDWKRVQNLQEEIGILEFDAVVEIFQDEVSAVISRLSNDPDPGRFEEDLHFLKGCAINLGFEDMANKCRAGETIAARGQADTVDLQVVFDSFTNSCQDFTDGLKSRRIA